MQQKTSIKGNYILFESTSSEEKIEKILIKRFEDTSILDKTIEDLHDPYLLKDMDLAVKRIKKAKENDEKVVVFGDYDVDGVTSTSLLIHLFTTLKMKASYRLPHRIHDGYGLKKKFIDELAPLGVTLIITVDCGSRDAEIVSYAKTLGVDIIVTDHHNVPKDEPDDAVAFINPTQPNCSYPFKGLAGAGVAYKLMCALAKEYFDEKTYKQYILEGIDVAAAGTVADCMQLVGENRIIVIEGLRQLKQSRSRGLRTLIEDKMGEDLDGDVFGFLIGPRLNAAGRMDTAYKAVNLILNNSSSLEDTLKDVEQLNDLRKAKTLEFIQYALEDINPKNNIILHTSDKIPHGIIGIVAGRLTEKYYRPSIVLKDEGKKYVASCRSPDYFSIIDTLENYKDLFIAFGGHKQAAGFSISKENYPIFEKKITEELNSVDFSQHKKELHIDKCIQLDEIGFKLLESMNNFKPFGMGNPKPLFMIQGFIPEKIKFIGKGREHLKIENRYGFKIFAFGFGEYYEELRKETVFDLIFDISEDSWMGKRGIMIKVVDIIIPQKI